MTGAGRVAVVGGGVVGLCAAHFLRRAGADVVVLERSRVGAGASSRNAGWIVPLFSAPLPAPGRRLSLIGSDAPLRIRRPLSPSAMSWARGFRRRCDESHHRAGRGAMARLARGAMDLYEGFREDGMTFHLRRTDIVLAFPDERSAREHLDDLAAMAEHGFAVPERILAGSELRSVEPSLSDRAGAGYVVQDQGLVGSDTLLRGLTARLRDMGVDVTEGDAVVGFDRAPGGGPVRALLTTKGRIEVGSVLLAAGAWTRTLASLLGLRLPILAGKGYSFSSACRVMPALPLYLVQDRIACTPMGDRLRVAGRVDVGPIDERIELRRVAGMLDVTGRYLPGLDRGVREVWCGMRPLLPDGLPMVGRLPGVDNVYMSTGHGTLGMTLAPSSGEAVAEQILTGRRQAVLAPFDPARWVRARGSTPL